MFKQLVLDCFDLIDIEFVFHKASSILGVDISIFNTNVSIDNNIRAFGSHKFGEINISSSFISDTLNNLLIDIIHPKKRENFIKYFIEATLSHEIHHAYMYLCKNKEYLKLKDLEMDYAKDILELEADTFMINYMKKYYGEIGLKVAQVSK